jgi:cellulose biosynthesis protein BcsQ
MIISVYSPKPGYGASTVARMLAYSLALRESALYVELDYYYPSTPVISDFNDHRQSLDHAVDQFNQKGGKDWSFHHYVRRYPKTNLSLLAPLGMKGFERFPEEHPDFIQALIDQAARYGYKHVVFDVFSLPDTIFCREALAHSDLTFGVIDSSLTGIVLFYQRLELLKQLHVVEDMELVVNFTQRSAQYNKLLKYNLVSKTPVATIPYLSTLSRMETNSRIDVPLKAKREIGKLIERIDDFQQKGAIA